MWPDGSSSKEDNNQSFINGIGLFAKGKLGMKNIAGFCSGTLSFQNFCGRRHTARLFEEGDLWTSVENFQTFLGIFQR